MMDVLPNVPVILLAVIAVWFYWPMIVDPLMGRENRNRGRLAEDLDDVAEDLFDSWKNRSAS